MRGRWISSALTLSLAALITVPTAHATEQEAGTTAEARSDWQRKKCAVFEAAFADLVKGLGTDGASDAFLAGSRAYIDSGCLSDVDACPQTEKDFSIANGLTIATMNAGAASTFSPFRCRSDN
jgi:hypothetical protein